MYQLPELAKVPGLLHGFSTCQEGNMRYGLEAAPKAWKISERRDLFLRQVVRDVAFPFRVSVEMAAGQPGFEEAVVIVGTADAGRGMASTSIAVPCEAMVTCSPNLFPFLTVGDCPPVVIFDPRTRTLALVHAGRESTIRRIPEKTLLVMQSQFKVDPTDVLVGMGPGFRSHFLERLPVGIDDPLWNIHIRPNGHRTFLMDLFGYNEDRLVAAGVPEEQIETCPLDTYTDIRFFSHRRMQRETGEPPGRHACVIGMVG